MLTDGSSNDEILEADTPDLKIHTDKFRISGTAAFKRDAKSALYPLIKALGFIVGDEADTAEVVDPIATEQHEEDLFKRADTIVINDDILWDVSQDTWSKIEIEENSESLTKESKAKLKKAKSTFVDFSNTSFANTPGILKYIHALNRDILRSAVWEMVSKNYKLNNSECHFTVELPPSPNTNLKLKRQDHDQETIISLELNATVYEAIDLEKGERIYLDKTWKTKVLYEENDGLAENTGKPICQIELKITLLLYNSPEIEPEVTIEITVHSNCPTFRYSGGWALEILQLENIDHDPEFDLEASPVLVKDPKVLRLIDSSNIQFGILAEQLATHASTLQEGSFSLTPALTAILHFYNEAVTISLLKTSLIQSYITNNTIELSKFNLKNEILKAIKSYEILAETIIKQTQFELNAIINKLSDPVISNLLILFQSSMIDRIKELALSYCSDPGSFIKKYGYTASGTYIYKINFTIALAIHCMHLAVKAIADARKIEMFGFNENLSSSTTPDKETREFIDFILSIINNRLKNNPFINNLMIGMVLPSQFQPLFEEDYFSSSLLIKRKKSDIKELEYELLHMKIPKPKTRLSCCPSEYYPTEKTAVLWERNPIVNGINDGLAVYFSIRQVLTIYPNARIAALPYLPITNMVAATIGMANGIYGIKNPNRPIAFSIRIWEGMGSSLVVFVFNLNFAITIYLADNPNTKNVSDLLFWTQIASAPLVLTAGHFAWRAVPVLRAMEANEMSGASSTR